MVDPFQGPTSLYQVSLKKARAYALVTGVAGVEIPGGTNGDGGCHPHKSRPGISVNLCSLAALGEHYQVLARLRGAVIAQKTSDNYQPLAALAGWVDRPNGSLGRQFVLPDR